MTTNINKAVTIKPGESFTIPPNSNILGITGTLISTCDNLPDPQDLVCYGAVFNIGYGGASSEPLDTIDLKGFKLNGIEYLFTSPVSLDSGVVIFTTELSTAIMSNSSLSSFLTNICGARYEVGGSGNGSRYIVSFKSLPSIVVDAYLITTITGEALPGNGTMDAYLPIKTRTQLTDEGVSTETCVCS